MFASRVTHEIAALQVRLTDCGKESNAPLATSEKVLLLLGSLFLHGRDQGQALTGPDKPCITLAEQIGSETCNAKCFNDTVNCGETVSRVVIARYMWHALRGAIFHVRPFWYSHFGTVIRAPAATIVPPRLYLYKCSSPTVGRAHDFCLSDCLDSDQRNTLFNAEQTRDWSCSRENLWIIPVKLDCWTEDTLWISGTTFHWQTLALGHSDLYWYTLAFTRPYRPLLSQLLQPSQIHWLPDSILVWMIYM